MCVCKYVYVRVCVRAHVCVCVHVCMRACVRACVCMYACVCMFMMHTELGYTYKAYYVHFHLSLGHFHSPLMIRHTTCNRWTADMVCNNRLQLFTYTPVNSIHYLTQHIQLMPVRNS